MAPTFREYVSKCATQAPHSWRKGQVAMGVLISAGLAALLFLGWTVSVFPTPIFLGGAALIALVDFCLLFPFHMWKADQERIEKLEAALKPSVELTEIVCATSKAPYTTEYRFYLKIRNGATALNNCLVKISSIEAMDETEPYTDHLPYALRTARNTERDGGGPFHLRANEEKRIPLCSRNAGNGSEWSIAYELGGTHIHSMRKTRDCDLIIGIYSDAAPTIERIKLRVGADTIPSVIRA